MKYEVRSQKLQEKKMKEAQKKALEKERLIQLKLDTA